jgi:UDP-GlcNAc:undecaprenyl-phosphate GlcNAc-1-phosphate transferase
MPTNLNWLRILASLLLGLGSSWAILGIILRWSERRLHLSRGREFHHAHQMPVPRWGGIAVAAAFTACAVAILFFTAIPASDAYTLMVILVSSLAMFGLGLWDDLRPLSAWFKLTGQILIAAAVYFCSIKIEIFKSPFTETIAPLGALSFFATVLWLVSLTNLINLIDGIDGLAGGISLMLMFLLAYVGMGGGPGFSMLLAIGVSGALIAFLRFNYPPAKIYLGDGGAYFLGFLIGILSIVNSNKGTIAAALLAPAFALALPIVDVSFAVLRRGLRGLPIFRPDQKHIHHHLITLGISREVTLLNLYTVSLLCLFLAFGVFYMQGRMLPLYTGLLFLVLLIAGHLSGLTKDWFALSSQLGKSLALRKETQYALVLHRWLILEVARQDSAEGLWQDYQFVVKKLRFCAAQVVWPDGATQVWRSEDFDPEAASQLHYAKHEIGNDIIIELYAKKAAMSDILFNLLGDLAAETWYKAATRWKTLDKPPLHLPAGADSEPLPTEIKTIPFCPPVGLTPTDRELRTPQVKTA